MQDVILDTTGDVEIKGNDLVVGFSDFQHQEHIIVSQKGQLKHAEDAGAGIENYVNDSEVEEMIAEVTNEFDKDGMEVSRIAYDEQTGDLDYDAKY